MLRNLLIVTALAASAALMPAAYRSNPQLFDGLLKAAVGNGSTDGTGPVLPISAPRDKPAAPQPLGRKVVLTADARGHFAAAFKVNGRQIDAMVDTGATLVALNISTARRVGISLNPSDFKHEVDTANGAVKVALVTIDRLQIGRIAVDNVQAAVLDDRALRTNLVGMSFLQRLGKFQAENGTLLLVQ